MQNPELSILGRDPVHRKHRLNGVSYQEEALTTFNGWQYAVFYASRGTGDEPLYVHLARRHISQQDWETLVFDDYPQSTDDGHNTAQLGICHSDGTIHLSYDHHCDTLRYRHSVPGLALRPADFAWSSGHFTATLNALPGLSASLPPFHDVSYPRFLSVGDDMLFTHRMGRAGLGSDVLYKYSASTGAYTFIGQHLTGVQNNPYINGLDYRNGRIHITWTYRGFVWYNGWDDPSDTKHKAQAGPNGAENNYDICYAYSDDLGETWKNGGGVTIAKLSKGESVKPDSEGIVAFAIPKGSGLTNQESQAVDYEGGVHVLNRDTTGGRLEWKHYYRSPTGRWSSTVIPGFNAESITKRGSIVVSKGNDLYLALPDCSSQSLKIVKCTHASGYESFTLRYDFSHIESEPILDRAYLEAEDDLSVLTTVPVDPGNKAMGRNVAVTCLKL